MTSLTYRLTAVASTVVAATSLIAMASPAQAAAAPHAATQTSARPTLAQMTRAAQVDAQRAKAAVGAAHREVRVSIAAMKAATVRRTAAYSRLDAARKAAATAQANNVTQSEVGSADVAAAQAAVVQAEAAVDEAVRARLAAGQRYLDAVKAFRVSVTRERRARHRAAVLSAALHRQRVAEAHARWVRDTRAAVVRAALSRVGASYTYGGEGPWGFDCSGLTMWSYAQVGIGIPHYSGAQMVTPRAVTVPLNAMVPGDLMYFGSGGSRHVAMYIGNGQIVEANNPSTGVRIDPAFASWNMYDYAGSTRLIY